MGSKPEEALHLFAAFFEKRPDLRPTCAGDGVLCCEGRWAWVSPSWKRYRDDEDALAYCRAHLARLVAEEGAVVYAAMGYYEIANECGALRKEFPTYDEALIAAAGELPELV